MSTKAQYVYHALSFNGTQRWRGLFQHLNMKVKSSKNSVNGLLNCYVGFVYGDQIPYQPKPYRQQTVVYTQIYAREQMHTNTKNYIMRVLFVIKRKGKKR